MSVTQVNVWRCDFCGAVASTTEETHVFSDPVVEYPKGWDTKEIPIESRKHPRLECGDACPACLGKQPGGQS